MRCAQEPNHRTSVVECVVYKVIRMSNYLDGRPSAHESGVDEEDASLVMRVLETAFLDDEKLSTLRAVERLECQEPPKKQ